MPPACVTRRCETHAVPTESLLEVTLFVADVRQSAVFYRAIGLELLDNEEDGEPYHVDGGIGETAVQLWPAKTLPVSRIQLGFRTRDLGVVADALIELGVEFETPSRRRLRTRDPDGNPVHLSEIAPCHRLIFRKQCAKPLR